MVLIKEFRIVMPMTLDEFEIAQMYMILKMQQENTSNSEGVDVLDSGPFEDSVLGEGHYSSKLYRFQSKIPFWLTAFAPADALVLKEESWHAYPKCKSVIKCPYFSKLLLTIETVHLADNGHSENVHGLSKEQLALRQVEVIDIASSVRDYWSYLVERCDVDLSNFRSIRTNRGPLLQGWMDKCNPVITAYKLVTVDAPYWCFGKRLEQALMAGERAIFLEAHRHCFAWTDEWYGMKIETLHALEKQLCTSSNEFKSKDAIDRRCSLENEDSRLKCKDCATFAFATSD